ncbi:MAG TPA: carbohydrate kinase family protein [Longimicrobiales bacterium]|nr:carbohydrate kinase family protein [Longimicrobiales bacterium]
MSDARSKVGPATQPGLRRLGVVGTLVWDRIYDRAGRAAPVEEWGGIAYALAAAVAACPRGWQVVPILKIGADLDARARAFLGTLPGIDTVAAVRTVPEANNRVELRYVDRQRRTERLTGGVPGWTWEELEPLLAGLDALYVNFIAGWEIDLASALRLRRACPGPLYADLHSLLLDVGPEGRRRPRSLAAWREWLTAFDVVQVNQVELESLAGRWGDPFALAAEAVGVDLRLLLVTLGERGAVYVQSPAYGDGPSSWRREGLEPGRQLAAPGATRSARIAPSGGARDGDPTGCGDVWGATCFAGLLSGRTVEDAIRRANEAAARNVEHHGASGLHRHLQGRIHT